MLKLNRLVVVVLISVLLCGCGVKEDEKDSETGNKVKAGSFICIPGRESEGLVYHKTSKTVYIIEENHPGYNHSTGFCALYRENNSFWKYDETNKKIVPETEFEADISQNESLDLSKVEDTDFIDVVIDYIENHELTDKQKDDLIFRLLDAIDSQE